MFKGNPRKPGDRSFEKIQFLLDDELMTRLENKSAVSIDDEWLITYLASDKVTGLSHEIEVLETMGLLEVKAGGKLTFAPGWQKKVPHMMLNEMRDVWGSEKDAQNLYCIHSSIRSIEKTWESIEGEGWRLTVNGKETFDLDLDDDEYEMRKQIFTENFQSYVNQGIGVGDFGC